MFRETCEKLFLFLFSLQRCRGPEKLQPPTTTGAAALIGGKFSPQNFQGYCFTAPLCTFDFSLQTLRLLVGQTAARAKIILLPSLEQFKRCTGDQLKLIDLWGSTSSSTLTNFGESFASKRDGSCLTVPNKACFAFLGQTVNLPSTGFHDLLPGYNLNQSLVHRGCQSTVCVCSWETEPSSS